MKIKGEQEVGIEDIKYQVYLEQRPKEVLHTGSIWECERWVSANGGIGETYVIDRIKEKGNRKSPKPKPFKAQPLF